ncbi:MAG TPA: hypothetical protein IGP91_11490 [Thermosynechococcus sp. M46_R2017_013]|nr:hypothetical protein [Thermosynechococcus sp. M46_R2017_013]
MALHGQRRGQDLLNYSTSTWKQEPRQPLATVSDDCISQRLTGITAAAGIAYHSP